jgi:serine/threonine-protein kinase
VSEKYNELVVAGTVQSVVTPFTELPRGSAVDLVVSLGPRPRTIPEAEGRPYDVVAAELEALSLNVQREEEPTTEVDEGLVTRIEPGAGSTVPRDSTVVVYVAVALVEVPDVSGSDIASASAQLAAVGLDVSGVQGSPLRPVVGTDPPAGTLVGPDSSVTLITGGGRGGGGNGNGND